MHRRFLLLFVLISTSYCCLPGLGGSGGGGCCSAPTPSCGGCGASASAPAPVYSSAPLAPAPFASYPQAPIVPSQVDPGYLASHSAGSVYQQSGTVGSQGFEQSVQDAGFQQGQSSSGYQQAGQGAGVQQDSSSSSYQQPAGYQQQSAGFQSSSSYQQTVSGNGQAQGYQQPVQDAGFQSSSGYQQTASGNDQPQGYQQPTAGFQSSSSYQQPAAVSTTIQQVQPAAHTYQQPSQQFVAAQQVAPAPEQEPSRNYQEKTIVEQQVVASQASQEIPQTDYQAEVSTELPPHQPSNAIAQSTEVVESNVSSSDEQASNEQQVSQEQTSNEQQVSQEQASNEQQVSQEQASNEQQVSQEQVSNEQSAEQQTVSTVVSIQPAPTTSYTSAPQQVRVQSAVQSIEPAHTVRIEPETPAPEVHLPDEPTPAHEIVKSIETDGADYDQPAVESTPQPQSLVPEHIPENEKATVHELLASIETDTTRHIGNLDFHQVTVIPMQVESSDDGADYDQVPLNEDRHDVPHPGVPEGVAPTSTTQQPLREVPEEPAAIVTQPTHNFESAATVQPQVSSFFENITTTKEDIPQEEASAVEVHDVEEEKNEITTGSPTDSSEQYVNKFAKVQKAAETHQASTPIQLADENPYNRYALTQ